jgi:bacillolysin
MNQPTRSARSLLVLVAAPIVLLALSLGACRTGDIKTTPKERLESETGTRWIVDIDPDTGTPAIATAVNPIPPTAGDGNYENAARAFLDKYKDLFALKDVSKELVLERVTDEADAGGNVRFQQRSNGLDVDRKKLIVQFRPDKSIAMVTGATRPKAAEVATTPVVDGNAALAAAEADLKKRYPDYDHAWLTPAPVPASVLYPSGASAKLAWAIRPVLKSANVNTAYVYRIDATSGALLEGYEDIAGVTGTGIGAAGDSLSFEVAQAASGYAMVRLASFNLAQIQTHDFGAPNAPISSATLGNWDPRTIGQGGVGAAVSATAYIQIADDFFRERFNWSGVDGKGTKTPLYVYVHEHTPKYAYFDMDRGFHFSDSEPGTIKPTSAGLDVCAHEFTHGVIWNRVALTIVGESGSLNEALADIFSTFVENAHPPPGSNLYAIGEAVFGGKGLRDFAHPMSAPGKQVTHKKDFDQAPPDVYKNAGIITNAFYLMTKGGTNDGSADGKTPKISVNKSLGIEKSAALWWISTNNFGTSMTFEEVAKVVSLQALLKWKEASPELEAVACAWVATGLLDNSYVKENYKITCYCESTDGGGVAQGTDDLPCCDSGADAGADKCCKQCKEDAGSSSGDPGNSTCGCRAGDGPGDFLCKTKPPNAEAACDPASAVFSGETGQSCQGYGKREKVGAACFCVTSDGSYLCPQAFDLATNSCNAPDGTRSFYDIKDGDSCSGSQLGTNPDTGAAENQSKSGTATDCGIRTKPIDWVDVSGKLECGG